MATSILRLLPVAALLLAGCATLRAYPGEPRDASQVACLRPAVMPGRQILLDAVDGSVLGWLQDRAELLPGDHAARVTVVMKGREREAQFTHTLRFTAKPGHDYLVYAELDPSGLRTFILDDQEGSVVAETSTPSERRAAR